MTGMEQEGASGEAGKVPYLHLSLGCRGTYTCETSLHHTLRMLVLKVTRKLCLTELTALDTEDAVSRARLCFRGP